MKQEAKHPEPDPLVKAIEAKTQTFEASGCVQVLGVELREVYAIVADELARQSGRERERSEQVRDLTPLVPLDKQPRK